MFTIIQGTDSLWLVLAIGPGNTDNTILERCKSKRLAMSWIHYLNGGKHPFNDNGEARDS